jgi:glycosyltransferase involved in cell wall biosynthesis
MPKKITVFIPTLNEAHGLPIILPQVQQQNPFQILVVDGNSTDGTADTARKLGAEVFIQKRKGLRHAFIEAWPLIRGDVVITLSPDGNCIPADIPKLVAEMEKGYDMVVASRYYGGAKSEDDDVITGFGNWFFTRTVNTLFRAHYTDCMGMFRAYRPALFYETGLDREDSYQLPESLFGTVLGIEPLLSARAAAYGMKISEIGSDEPKRMGGERKLQVIRWGGAYYFQFLREFLFGRRRAFSVPQQPPA